jgi:hypothetical protein
MNLFRISGKVTLVILALAGTTLVCAQNFEALKVPSPLGEIVRNLDVDERGPV